jgi:hypothetical protein
MLDQFKATAIAATTGGFAILVEKIGLRKFSDLKLFVK